MARHHFGTHPITRLAAGGSLLAAGAGVGTLGAALFAQSAGAAGTTYVVTTLDDPVSPDPDNCITPGPNPCSLREAILAANADIDADTITFDPSLSGTIVLGSSLEPLSGSLTVTGPGADVLTIEGNRAAFGFLQNPGFRGSPFAADFRFEVSGLHLDGMNAQFPGGDVSLGAITVFSGDLNVRDVTVTDSASNSNSNTVGGSYLFGGPISAGLLGGGLISPTPNDLLNSATFERVTVTNNDASGGNSILGNSSSIVAFAYNVDLIDSTVTGNTAAMLGGPLLWAFDVNVSGTTITDNTSLGQWAGLLMVTQSCSVSGSVIDHNQAQQNAGLFLSTSAGQISKSSGSDPTSGRCTVSDTSISYNTVTSGGGSGGVSTVYGQNPIELNRVTMIGNISPPSGVQPVTQGVQPASSGIYATLLASGNVSINSSTIANNTGDAILLSGANLRTTSSDSIAERSTSSANSLTSALAQFSHHSLSPRSNANAFYSTLHISHSTISGNSGTGINAVPTPNYQPTPANVVLDHALIHGNGTGPAGDLNVLSTARFSLIGAAGTTPVDGAGGGNLLGVDPLLQPLQWTSPLVGVMPILFGSAAWNAGDPSFVPPPETDQRGLPRVVDIIDIGAYEVQEELQLPKFTG